MDLELQSRLFPMIPPEPGSKPIRPWERLIVVGDVHGCADELSALMDVVKPGPQDQVLLLGDLVNRGPDTPGVLAQVRQLKALSLLGNHDYRLLRYYFSHHALSLTSYDMQTIERLQPEDWQTLSSLMLTLEDPIHQHLFVHGGFHPQQDWRSQGASIVTEIQCIDAEGKPQRRKNAPSAPFWADLWSGPEFVVYGHTPRREVYRTPMTLGIDTGCVYGGHLTAYILPTREIVQVRAKRAYAP